MHVVNECVHILRNEFSREKRDEQMNCILNATDIAGIGQSEVLFGVSYSKLCGLLCVCFIRTCHTDISGTSERWKRASNVLMRCNVSPCPAPFLQPCASQVVSSEAVDTTQSLQPAQMSASPLITLSFFAKGRCFVLLSLTTY